MGLNGRKRGRIQTDLRWLDPETTAAYLGVWVEALPRLVGQGKIPRPSYHLGYRTPRWDREELDRALREQRDPKRRRAEPAGADASSEPASPPGGESPEPGGSGGRR